MVKIYAENSFFNGLLGSIEGNFKRVEFSNLYTRRSSGERRFVVQSLMEREGGGGARETNNFSAIFFFFFYFLLYSLRVCEHGD